MLVNNYAHCLRQCDTRTLGGRKIDIDNGVNRKKRVFFTPSRLRESIFQYLPIF